MTDRIAILIDGENVSPDHAAAILAEAEKRGVPILRRVYGHATRRPRWAELAGFRFVHASGKRNAADMALAIDAVDLWRSGAFDAALLVTSDGDFSHLAIWLREHGARVTGMGEAKAPAAFRAASARFVEFGDADRSPVVAPPLPKDTIISDVRPRIRSSPTTPSGLADVHERIRRVIERHAKGIPLPALNAAMQKEDRSFRISAFPERTWWSYLSVRPALYELHEQRKDARVRLIPVGSGTTARAAVPPTAPEC